MRSLGDDRFDFSRYAWNFVKIILNTKIDIVLLNYFFVNILITTVLLYID